MIIQRKTAFTFVCSLVVSAIAAHGQTPTSRNTAESSKEPLTNLLAQARPQWRAGFSLMPSGSAANETGPIFRITATAAGANLNVLGSGTLGRLTKWTGFTSSNSLIGDSTIFESKFGLVGIGTDTPASKLTVAGLIETTTGGVKFPDGTTQTTAGVAPNDVVRSLNGLKGNLTLAGDANIEVTQAGNTITVAAPNVLTAVAHDATLTGNGTQASPLGVASPLEVRDRDNPARQPIQASSSCQPEAGAAGCSAAILNVPAGKRLVIEYASMLAFISAGQVAFFELTTSVNGNSVTHAFPTSQPSVAVANSIPQTNVGQQVRIYADPGTEVRVIGVRSGSAVVDTFTFKISGHFVDLP